MLTSQVPPLPTRPKTGSAFAAIPAARRCHGIVVAFTLQSTVGGFTPEFMRKLPRLEQAMIARGLEPSFKNF